MMKLALYSMVLAGLVLSNLCFGQVRRQGALVLDGIPEIPERIGRTLNQYSNVRGASMIGWDAKGEGIVIATRFAETSQFHYVARPGGARRQMTFYEEPVRRGQINPDTDRHEFLFTRDVGGSEFYQLFLFDMATGQDRMLTEGEARNTDGMWSNQGDFFTFCSTKRNGRDTDVYLWDRNKLDAEPVRLTEREGAWYPVDFSPNEKLLLVERYVSATESHYYILDIATKEMTRFNPSDTPISYGFSYFSADGKGIYVNSDEGTEFKQLRYYDLKTGKQKNLTASIPWDVQSTTMSRDRSRIAFAVNAGGMYELYLMDCATNTYKPIRIPVGLVSGLEFDPAGKRLAMCINTAKTPGDVFVYDLADESFTRWTFSEVGGLNTDAFIEPEIIHYDTFDTVDGAPRKIPAFYYPAKDQSKASPVVIIIHGGPEGQFKPSFSSSIQYYIQELGMAVLAPNVRGSSGYGKEYIALDNGFKREDSVKDIGSLLDWIDENPKLDSNRIAVMGGSYGGYMSLACMARYNDRLRCGIDIVGISNFVTFLENTKDYRRDLRRVEYGDERDPAMRKFLLEISPTNNADKMKKPMLIAQGLNDPRVPAGEAEQIVKAVRENGGQAWYLLAEDEGHGFAKKTNRDYYRSAVVYFLEQYLLDQ